MTISASAASPGSMPLADSLETTLMRLAEQYPPALRAQQIEDVPRIAFHVALLRRRIGAGRVCDLGGGIGLFSVGCAAAGLSAILVDDFADAIAGHPADELLQLHRAHGVVVLQRDLMTGLDVEPASLDAVTCFHSIEHWHHSPKRLFEQVMTALRPGGLFLLAAPNAVNLRKRLSVPLGYGNWSPLSDWYDAERFRGHVREPTLGDLRAIAARMGLVDVTTFGRNWLGRSNRRPAIRAVTAWVDPLIQLRASLCSDIYVMGRKPLDAGRMAV